jgi:hypothetical protein
MKKIVKIASLLTLCLGSVQAQNPTNILELDFTSLVPAAGPNTIPLTVPFSLDPFNDNNFTVPTYPLDITLSFKNQVFTNLPYINLYSGLTFGGGATLSNSGPVQIAGSNIPYDLLGTYSNGGGPKNDMFTSDPYATGADTGKGFDVNGTLPNPNYTGGFQLFTAAQVLFNQNYPKNARVYFGDLVITFSQPVKNPVIHIAGLGGSYSFLPFGQPDSAQYYLTSFFTTELELENTGLTSTLLSSNGLLTLSGNNMYNNYSLPNGNSVNVTGEYPINNYGAMTGSVLINGVVKELVYRVYLKGSDSSDINWSTEGMDSTKTPPTQLVTGATADPFTGDIWWVSASLRNPYQQLSGNVFLDADALVDNDIATTATTTKNIRTNIGGAIYANLIDAASGLVIAEQTIAPDGSYLFDSLNTGVYKVVLSAINGTIGDPAPPAVLPVGWMNTGEQFGLTTGDDGNVDGESIVVSLGPDEVITNVNFGVQQIPNSDPKIQQVPEPVANAIPQGTATNSISGVDPEDGVLGNPQKMEIKVLPGNANVLYNNTPLTVGTIITNFNPSLLSYTNITNGSTNIVFQYAFFDRADAQDPTPATYTVFWTIPLGVQELVLTGAVKANFNELIWEITDQSGELNQSKLYRSVNNSTDKTLISTKPASGNTKFTFDDVEVENNTVYNYTAEAIDKAGKVYQSNTVTLVRNGVQGVSVFPNPVKDILSITFEVELVSNATVLIQDVAGKTISRIEIPGGGKQAQINMEMLPIGVYNINIYNDEIGEKVIKVVKK